MVQSSQFKAKVKMHPSKEFRTLVGKSLLDLDGNVVKTRHIDSEFICVYVSARYCPPCKIFSKQLREFYNEINSSSFDGEKAVEVIFCSQDKSKEEYDDYYKSSHLWLTIPFENVEIRNNIRSQYQIPTIPCLLVFSKSGKFVTNTGRNDIVELKANDVVNKWIKNNNPNEAEI